MPFLTRAALAAVISTVLISLSYTIYSQGYKARVVEEQQEAIERAIAATKAGEAAHACSRDPKCFNIFDKYRRD